MSNFEKYFDEAIVVTNSGIVPLIETNKPSADGYRKGDSLFFPVAGKYSDLDSSYVYIFVKITGGKITGIYAPNNEELSPVCESKINNMRHMGHNFYLPKNIYLAEEKLRALGMNDDAIYDAITTRFIPPHIMPVRGKPKYPHECKDTRSLEERNSKNAQSYNRNDAKSLARMEAENIREKHPFESLKDSNFMFE